MACAANGLPRRVNLVKQLVEALSLEFRKHFAHTSSDERSWARNGDIRIVDVLEDVLGTREHADESWHLLENRTLPLALGCLSSLRKDSRRSLDHYRNDASRVAPLVGHR